MKEDAKTFFLTKRFDYPYHLIVNGHGDGGRAGGGVEVSGEFVVGVRLVSGVEVVAVLDVGVDSWNVGGGNVNESRKVMFLNMKTEVCILLFMNYQFSARS